MATLLQIHPENPQPRLITKAAEVLRDGGLIAYPTDSCYALGCALENKEGIERITRIRQLNSKHHFTLMCHDFAQLGQFVIVDNSDFRAIKSMTPGPYTFIMKATKVDGIYTADPMKDSSARRYDRISYLQVLEQRLQVMDATAISLCMDNRLPILVFNLRTPGHLRRAVQGEPVGTTVSA